MSQSTFLPVCNSLLFLIYQVCENVDVPREISDLVTNNFCAEIVISNNYFMNIQVLITHMYSLL
jgi:hypothetical protein